MDQKKSSFEPVAFTLTVLAALLRLAPHPPNFTPVGSVALFGGARLRGWQAYCVPLLAMLVTDPIRSKMEGSYAAYSWTTLVVYGCFALNVLLGRVFLRHSSQVWRIALVALAGSVQFFLITNLFSWWGAGSLYPQTFSGLLECYVAALPFFGRTILGDLFYSGVLFTAYAFLRHRISGEHQTPAAL
ncbi:MAG: hypothetical protein JO097_07395 [Acidobacteriaceae bacterium]|nr:hypothetical protein [Acidobacteriaceae bacterium]MBV9767766.1 hypothetical protein [Acidobacteriaceae bacterium]